MEEQQGFNGITKSILGESYLFLPSFTDWGVLWMLGSIWITIQKDIAINQVNYKSIKETFHMKKRNN